MHGTPHADVSMSEESAACLRCVLARNTPNVERAGGSRGSVLELRRLHVPRRWPAGCSGCAAVATIGKALRVRHGRRHRAGRPDGPPSGLPVRSASSAHSDAAPQRAIVRRSGPSPTDLQRCTNRHGDRESGTTLTRGQHMPVVAPQVASGLVGAPSMPVISEPLTTDTAHTMRRGARSARFRHPRPWLRTGLTLDPASGGAGRNRSRRRHSARPRGPFRNGGTGVARDSSHQTPPPALTLVHRPGAVRSEGSVPRETEPLRCPAAAGYRLPRGAPLVPFTPAPRRPQRETPKRRAMCAGATADPLDVGAGLEKSGFLSPTRLPARGERVRDRRDTAVSIRAVPIR